MPLSNDLAKKTETAGYAWHPARRGALSPRCYVRSARRSHSGSSFGSDRQHRRFGEQEIIMAALANPDQLVNILRDTIVALVRRDGPDLSARQLGVFLTVYLTDGPHTVRGLAAELNVSKPAITRALDRLGELDLARRKVDPMDRRSVIVQRTLKGAAFLRDMRQIMTEAEATSQEAAASEAATAEPARAERRAG